MKSVLSIAGAVILLAGLAMAVAVIRSGASGASPALPVAYRFDGHQDGTTVYVTGTSGGGRATVAYRG